MQLSCGFSVGMARADGTDDFFLTIEARGKLTHEDYLSLVPMLESAIEGVRARKLRNF